MPRMTRTQITLQEDEYLFLKDQAVMRGASLSSIVRSLVRERMGQSALPALHVWEIAGVVTTSDFTGKDHDAVLSPPEDRADVGAGRTGPL
jgi:hypothetical protein